MSGHRLALGFRSPRRFKSLTHSQQACCFTNLGHGDPGAQKTTAGEPVEGGEGVVFPSGAGEAGLAAGGRRTV